MSEDRRARIRALNDHLRIYFEGGRVVITQGIDALGDDFLLNTLNAMRRFDAFNEANDPYGEHDFGALTIGSQRVFWKIDYFDPSMTSAAVDPASASLCQRVLTIMLAEEY